jgi:glycopeptide antibiotics resistance protein
VPGGVLRWIPVVVVSVAALPLAYAAVAALVRYRDRAPGGDRCVRRRTVAEVAMVAGTVPWVWMVLTPLPGRRELRLVPLADLADQVAGSPVTAFFQIGGNLLVFAAFGFFAPLRWPLTPAVVAGLAACASVAVEATQYLLHLGRVSSVDDVLLNAAGAGLAALAARHLNDRSGMA